MNKIFAMLLVVVALILGASSQLFAVDTYFEVEVVWLDAETRHDEDLILTVTTTNGSGGVLYDLNEPMELNRTDGLTSFWAAEFEVDLEATNWKVLLDASGCTNVFDVYVRVDGNSINFGDDNIMDLQFEEIVP